MREKHTHTHIQLIEQNGTEIEVTASAPSKLRHCGNWHSKKRRKKKKRENNNNKKKKKQEIQPLAITRRIPVPFFVQ